MQTDNFYELWKLPIEKQELLLGMDIGLKWPTAVVELDEMSQRSFYKQRFAPLIVKQFDCPYYKTEVFEVFLPSLDDHALQMVWEVKKMDIPAHEAREKITKLLQRTNYFVNFKGLEHFCMLFGKPLKVEYN